MGDILKYSPEQIYTKIQLEEFKTRCVKAKFSGLFDKWVKVKYIDSWKKDQSVKTNFADWVILFEHKDLEEKKLEKIFERLDKL